MITEFPNLLPDASISWDVSNADKNDPCYLMAAVRLLGVDCHLCAIRVENDETNSSQVAYGPCTYDLNAMCELTGTSEPFQTTTIPGYPGDWVIHLLPFSN